MKCNYCGYNLGIEDLFCPHCGKQNEHTAKHMADMEHYEKEFAATKEEVIKNSRSFNNITARIVVICVLVVIMIGGFVAISNSYEIRAFFWERNVEKNMDTYCAKIDEYERERDYMSLYYYMSNNRLSYSKPFDEYSKVCSCAMKYAFIYEDIMDIVNRSNNMTDLAKEQTCETIAANISRLPQDAQRQSYDKDEYYKTEHQEFMDDCLEDTRDLVQVYFGLSDDDADKLYEMNKSRLSVLLIDSLVNFNSNNEGSDNGEDME